MSSLTQLRVLLRQRLGNPTVVDVPEVDLTARLNEAYKEIIAKYKFHKARKLCTFDTVIGQEKYGLPSDCYAVLRLRDNTNKMSITKAGDTAYANRTSTADGKPVQYVRYRDWISLMPPPDGIYTIEMFYVATPVSLVADGDVPALPEPWHIGIVLLGRYQHFDSSGDLPKAALAQTAYDRWAATMPLEFDEEAERIDSAVEIPTLSGTVDRRLDFDHSL